MAFNLTVIACAVCITIILLGFSSCEFNSTQSENEAMTKMIEAGADPLDVRCMFVTDSNACTVRATK